MAKCGTLSGESHASPQWTSTPTADKGFIQRLLGAGALVGGNIREEVWAAAGNSKPD
jgi:hypothetical protein